MFQVFIAIQCLGIVILILNILYLYSQKPSRQRVLLMTIFHAVLINFIGYLMELTATSKELALQAVKFIYVGKPVIILGTFLFAMEFYKVKIPAAIEYALCSIHIAVMALVLTSDYHSLYYNKVDFVDEGYFPHLVLGHGIVYNIYLFFIVAYQLILLALGIRRYLRAEERHEKRQIFYMCTIPVVSGISLLIFMSGITKGYDSTLPAYLYSAVILLVLMVRYDLLNTLETAKASVIDEFADGLLVFDRDERLIYMNPQAQKVYPKHEELNPKGCLQELRDFARENTRKFVDDKVYRIREKEILVGETVKGYMYVVTDVTESHNHTIDLEKQTRIAEQANRAKSDFLARVSHEIRTPINSIIGMNEMILRQSSERRVKEYAMDVKSSAASLLSIINDILDSSKIEAGKMEILPVNYELDSMVHDVVNMVFYKTRDRGLEFRVDIDPKLPNGLRGDDLRIRQILVNLLNNSVKYTERGSVTFRVTGEKNGEVERLHFAIADTGIGIKEEDLPKLYASFERIEEDRNRHVEGTGLGMSIVVDLLHMMDSKLEVESVYGEGSTFGFYLDQTIVDEGEIGNYQERFKNMSQDHVYTSLFVAPDAKALVVDDNEVNRRVFKNLLADTRMQIAEASSGAECLERVKKEHYHIIYLDHMMPGMDGVETLKRMKEMADGKCANTPVIMLTANAVAGSREKYLAAGFDDFLSKPLDPEKLEITTKLWLPEELVLAAQEQKVRVAPPEEVEYPELEGFDWDYARAHIKDDAILRQLISDMYYSMNRFADSVGELAENVDTEEGLTAYRIEVHSVKSNMATIGALTLSSMAEELEQRAIEGNVDAIRLETPKLAEAIRAHRERLAVLVESAAKEKLDVGQALTDLEELIASLENADYDAADSVMERLNAYKYDGEAQTLERELAAQVVELEDEEAIQTAQRLREILKEA